MKIGEKSTEFQLDKKGIGNQDRENEQSKTRNTLRNMKLALGLGASLALAGCGGKVSNNYMTVEPPALASVLCTATISVDTEKTEAMVDVGRTVKLANGYHLELLDVDADKPAAVFLLKDSSGNSIKYVTFEEGVDHSLSFKDKAVSMAVCSALSSGTNKVGSVELRSDSDLALVDPTQNPLCSDTETEQVTESTYSPRLPLAEQSLIDGICDNQIIIETATFDPGIATLSDNMGNVEGVAIGRVTVQVLANNYAISDLAKGRAGLALEAVSGVLNQGESLDIDNMKFRLDDLEANGGITSAMVSVVDSNGDVLAKDTIAAGETKMFTVGGKVYPWHVYELAPGHTFGAKWADMAIFSSIVEAREDTPYAGADGR